LRDFDDRGTVIFEILDCNGAVSGAEVNTQAETFAHLII
jgi:hypothetical protein